MQGAELKLFVILLVLMLIGGLYAWFKWGGSQQPVADQQESMQTADYKDATYTIEGSPVALVGGTAQTQAAPGSASMVTTQYFGNEARGDLDQDGDEDIAFLLTQTSGGSGTFYYAAVALNDKGRYRGTNAILLGDRIAPQTTSIQNGQVVVNYATRNEGEPMTAQPSVGVSKYLEVSNGQLREVSAPSQDGAHAGTPIRGTVTFRGTIVCLPHKNAQPGEPQTLECAFGLKDETGVYYGLSDTSGDYSIISSAPMNTLVEVTGVYEPMPSDRYESKGVIQVNRITPVQ